MVENALSRRSRYREKLKPKTKPRRPPIFYSFFINFLIHFLITFGTMLGPILGPDLPKRDQDEPKRAIRIFKEPKTCIYKKVVFAWDCRHFFTLKASQERLKKPKRHPRSSKTIQKNIKNWIQKLTNFRQLLQLFWTPKCLLKLLKKRENFPTPLPPHLRGPNNAPPKNKREGWKNCLSWNYILQKKGRDKALQRPYKAS